MSELFQHHMTDSPLWSVLIDAANLEHDGDWPVVEVAPVGGLPVGGAFITMRLDYSERITSDEIIYADDNGPGWLFTYSLDTPYDLWDVRLDLQEPANIVTPGYLMRHFEDALNAGETVRFQCVEVDTYVCDECREQEDLQDRCINDHLLGWALVYASTPTVQTLNGEGKES